MGYQTNFQSKPNKLMQRLRLITFSMLEYLYLYFQAYIAYIFTLNKDAYQLIRQAGSQAGIPKLYLNNTMISILG